MSIAKRFVLTLTIALACITAAANNGKYTLRQIDSRMGLPDNSINAIVQDHRGFMWFGTWNGLALFDGVNYYTYYADTESTTSLLDNMVRSLCPTNDGLWVGTDSGLCFFSYDNCTFHQCFTPDSIGNPTKITSRINHIINVGDRTLALDIHGNIFVPTKDEYVFKIQRPCDGETIVAICPYDNKQVILSTTHGIRIADATTLAIVKAYDNTNETSREYGNVYYSGNTGMIYVGNGLGKPSCTYQILPTGDINLVDAFVPDNLMATVDAGGNTYFATDGSGLWLVNKNGRTINFNETNSNYRGPAIYSIAADSNDNVWVGSYRRGVWVYSQQFNTFRVANKENGLLEFDIISSISHIGDKMYFGLDGGGLQIVNTNRHNTERCLNSSNSELKGDNVVTSLVDGDNLWLGIYTKGLACYNTKTGKIVSYSLPPQENNNNIWMICDDGKGRLWLCSRTLYTFDKLTHTFETVEGMSNKVCMSIVQQGHYMYVGTRSDGIFKIDNNTRSIIEHYSRDSENAKLPSNIINCFNIDSKGDFWMSIKGYGLCKWERDNGQFQIIGAESGMPEKRITSITEDRIGNMWFGTDNGLYLQPHDTKHITKIDDQAIPTTFVYNSSSQQGDTIYFGTTQGLLSFNTLDVKLSRYTGKCFFMGLKVMSDHPKLINIYNDTPNNIVLEPYENFITICFSVPELLNPGSVRYSYRLIGFEDSWHVVDYGNEATYSNLNAGKYEMEVRHLMPNGQWSEASVLPIIIKPYWWNTTLANTIWWLLLLLCIGAIAYAYAHTMRIKQRAKIAEIEKESEKALHNAKLDLYAQITHDIRTPAFLISAQLEGLLDTNENVIQVRKSQIQGILQNSHKLNKMVNRIIDIRKMDSGRLTLVCKRSNVVQFINTLLPYYKMLCEQKSLKFQFESNDASILMDFDPDKLEMIISNLISNAYKYTPEFGSVALSVQDQGDCIMFSVKDTGIGIVKEAQSQIFDKYIRTERGKKQSSGDGLGLSYVKEIVALYGGTIMVVSAPNEGAEFIVKLPKWQVGDEVATEQIKDEYTIPSQQYDGSEYAAAINPAAAFTLLIVDDDPGVGEVIAHAFNDAFKVYVAKNGNEGFRMAKDLMPDCILTDIMMPGTDGLQMINMIRQDKSLKHLRIVVFTAKDSEDDMTQGYKLGVDAWYIKPMSLKLLKMHILKLLTPGEPTPSSYQPISSESQEHACNAINKDDQEFLGHCREIIDENLQNPDFNLGLMAEKLAMSHSTLYKRIRRITGLSLIDFVSDYRIWKAVSLFKRGETNVTKVCEACGFHDLKTFRDSFKRKMGVPPKKFIQDLK